MLTGVVLAIVSFVFLLLAVKQGKKSRTQKIIDKIPGPPGIPFFGNLFQLKTDGHDFFAQIIGYCEKYGKDTGIMRLWLVNRPMIFLNRAETAEIVFKSSKNIQKAFFYDFLLPWLGTGLLISTGNKWHSRRKLLTPTFHFRILNDFMKVFNEQALIMVQKLDKHVGKGVFDIFPSITLCALDIICETAMGKKINAQNDSESEYIKAIYKISEIALMRLKNPLYWYPFTFNATSTGREHAKYLKILKDFTRQVIDERDAQFNVELGEKEAKDFSITDMDEEKVSLISGKKKRMAFLDMLLYAARGNSSISKEGIQEEVDTFMFEGHDTTAASASWACFLIGSHPEIQKQLQDEVDVVLGNDETKQITMDNIKDLKLLDCVIKETLRLYPSVPYFGREMTEDCLIGEFEVPKGTTVLIVPSSLHRHPDYFENPDDFIPDRWLAEKTQKRHPYAFVPFSAGLRNCIGQKFAMLEEKVLLANLLRRFTIKSTQTTEDLKPMGDLILRPQRGIFVELSSRSK